MTLLVPLGLLGLLGIVALIIIYIIRPNYQQKYISSTYIWKLSLKYRKKKIPTSKLRNILLILCQIVFLTTCAVILAQPNKVLRTLNTEPEVVLILDSSASMRAETGGMTRYARAVDEMRVKASDVFDENGYVTVIIANETPAYFTTLSDDSDEPATTCLRLKASSRLQLDAALASLVEDETQCTYSTADVDGAVALCEQILLNNPSAEVFLYSDNNYSYVPKTVNYVNVADASEWNGAVLDARAEYHENKYAFYVDIAVYGANTAVNVNLQIEGANALDSNDPGSNIPFDMAVECLDGETVSLLVISKEVYEQNEAVYNSMYSEDKIHLIPEGSAIATYHAIHVSLQEMNGEELNDSLAEDNVFDIYGGMKQVVKIQYASAAPNSFWPAAIRHLRNVLSDRWDIQYTEIKKNAEPAISGFDLYIFEHYVPEKLPEDGVLWIMAPQNDLPTDTGVKFSRFIEQVDESLMQVSTHPVLDNMMPEELTVSSYFKFILDDNYEPLLAVKDEIEGEIPMLALRNDDLMKIALWSFNLHYSNLAVKIDFPILVYNMFSHFFPTMVNGNAFNVNEEVQINAMADTLEILGYDYYQKLDTFPATFVTSVPGTYTLKQINFVGVEFREQIYVRMPKEESDIFKKGVALRDLDLAYSKDEFFEDLLFYIAIGLVSVAFIEWWLRNHKNA